MPTTWIITANAGRARFFAESDPAHPLQEVEDMVNSAVRLRVTETESDKLGPTAATNSSHNIGGTQGVGYAHNANVGAPNKAYQPAHTPAEQEAEQFARDISTYLLRAHQEGRFQHLVLSASPQFLGALRSFMDAHVKSLVKQELNKDYTHCNGPQLREQLHAQQNKSA
jgi:protein required for attachment to host cells